MKCDRASAYGRFGITCPQDARRVIIEKLNGTKVLTNLCSDHIKAYGKAVVG